MDKIIFLLLFLSHLTYIDAIRYEVTSPNIFRLNVAETVGISISDHNQAVEIEVYLQDYPDRAKTISLERFQVTPGVPLIRHVTFKGSDIPESQKNDEVIFVYLVVTTPRGEFPAKEILVPVRKYSGYAFLQTDKPLYLPKDTVHIRVLNLNEKLLPRNEEFILEIINPQGNRFFHDKILPDASGITEKQIKFPVIPMLGNWTVSVYYGYQMSGKRTVKFDLEEYVLPTFSVTIEPPKFILESFKIINTIVRAKYVYGKPVQGLVNIHYKIRDSSGLVIPLGASRLYALDEDGECHAYIDVEEDIKKRNIVWFPFILDSNLLIEVEVIEKATGVKEVANDYSSIFTKSPYKILFTRSNSDFKPGVPYHLRVDVEQVTGQAAYNIPVQIVRAIAKTNGVQSRVLPIPKVLKTDKLGRVMFKFETVSADQEIEITVATADTKYPEAQAVSIFAVQRYKSPDDRSYVWIASPGKDIIFEIGSTFETDINIYPAEDNIKLHYMVVSRGSILHLAETERQAGAIVRSIQFLITPEMSPSARLLVYIVRNNRIIADSMKIDVEEKCKYNDGNELKISAHSTSGFFKPDQSVNLKINGEVDSSVGVLAVDKAVYLLNEQDLLTREKLFQEMISQDIGCRSGGGVDIETVLRNVGVLMITNAQIPKHDRLECNSKSVEKRSIGAKVSDYSGFAATCCRLGQLEGPSDLDCEERANKINQTIGDKENCSQAFLDCCETLLLESIKLNKMLSRKLVNKNKNEDLGNIIEMKESETLKYTRWLFPETWFFTTLKIGSLDCKGDDPNICEVSLSVPHSITTWSVQAVGISKTNGMCVAKPFEILVFRSMFIQMKLPYSAIRGEQIEVPVTIFNYDDEEIIVNVYMIGVEGVCMGADPGEKSAIHKITVEKNSATTVIFPVMPLEVAVYRLKVVALSWGESDAVEKELRVEHKGVPEVVSFTTTLDPTGFVRNRKKRNLPVVGVEELFDTKNNRHSLSIDLDLPENYIRDSGRCQISLMSDLMGKAVSTNIEGLEGYFILPSGCGEQTMSKLARLVYSMTYLKRTDRLNSEFEKNGFNLMQRGYSHLQQYRNNDGSFAFWSGGPGNLWLTAYVAKGLCQAELFIQIANEVLCGAVMFIVNSQRPNGAFNIPIYIYDLTLGPEYEATETATTLISLKLCNKCDAINVKHSLTRAVNYVEERLNDIKNAYSLAIVTYALALNQSPLAKKANEKLRALALFDEATDSRFWNWNQLKPSESWIYQERPSALAVETTAYALLAQLQMDDILYSHAIANWLNQQRNHRGSFVSTQDTIIALQALAEYAYRTKLPFIDMTCNVSSQVSAREERSIRLNSANSLLIQEIEMPVGSKIHVDAVGTGIASMQVSLHYNVEKDRRKRCKFELDVKTTEYNDNLIQAQPKPEFFNFDKFPKNLLREILSESELKKKFGYDIGDKNEDNNALEPKHHVIKLKICFRYLENRPAGMSILDVGFFTGFQPVLKDIEKLMDDKSNPIAQFEPSDKSIIFYLDKVPHDNNTCIELRTYREIAVGKVHPTYIKIYDYYEPDKSCLKFYRPDGGSEMLKTICDEDQCRCLEGECPPCSPFDVIKEIKFDKDKRNKIMNLACDKHDFVWGGTLAKKYTKDSKVYFDFFINDVWKEGAEKKNSLKHKTITFTGREDCKCPKMRVGKDYAIMGKDGFRTISRDNDLRYNYVFNKRTSVYEMRLLKDLVDDPEEKSLQKMFNWLYRGLVLENRLKCD